MPKQPCCLLHALASGECGRLDVGDVWRSQEWLTAILKDDNYWDQNAFNDLMRRGAEYLPRRDDRLFKCVPCLADPVALQHQVTGRVAYQYAACALAARKRLHLFCLQGL